MKIISVGTSELTHLAFVPSAVTDTNLPAIYYDRAAFSTAEASVFINSAPVTMLT